MLVVVAGLVGAARTSRAQGWLQQPVLRPGQVEVGGALEVNLSTRDLAEPLSVAPDLAVGVGPRLTLALIHSARQRGEWTSGGGICLRSADHGCREAYQQGGLDARWLVGSGDGYWVLARGRLVSRTFDIVRPSLRLGLTVGLVRGGWRLVVDPQLQLGMWNRDLGNRDWLRVPIWFERRVTARVSAGLRTGIAGELAVFDDAYAISLGAQVRVQVSARATVEIAAGFPEILGPLNDVKPRHGYVALDVATP